MVTILWQILTLYNPILEFLQQSDVDYAMKSRKFQMMVHTLITWHLSNHNSFIARLELWKQNLGSNKLSIFQNLQKETSIADTQYNLCSQHFSISSMTCVADFNIYSMRIANIHALVLNAFVDIYNSWDRSIIQGEMLDAENESVLRTLWNFGQTEKGTPQFR